MSIPSPDNNIIRKTAPDGSVATSFPQNPRRRPHPIVHDGKICPAAEVRRAYRRLRPLEKLQVKTRGWTLDVLNLVRSLNKPDFSLADVYAHDEELARLHPANRHIRPKIRQQLQLLRDLGLLDFLSPGSYRLA